MEMSSIFTSPNVSENTSLQDKISGRIPMEHPGVTNSSQFRPLTPFFYHKQPIIQLPLMDLCRLQLAESIKQAEGMEINTCLKLIVR